MFLLLAILAAAVVLTSATKNNFTPHDKAFYADEAKVNFVRPGLVVQILNATVATDGTIQARVKFTDPQGLGLDINGITTPGKISNGAPGMIVAVFQDNLFTAYTTRVQTSTITGQKATQASTDSGGKWAQVAEGEYTYTFATKLPSSANRSAIHAIGVYASRVLTDFDLGTQLDDDVYYFTPSDGKATTNPREQIKTATCQKCHGPNMAFHGETGRSSVPMCDLCHQPQSTDPDTGNTVDLRVMVHKIHMGENLPSVKAGKPYQIIGFGNSVNDYSTVAFPTPNMACESCHDQTTQAKHATAYLTNPNRAACGACHDDVNFDTGVGHVNLPQPTDNQCKNCHFPEGELDFDASIKGAHVIPQESKMLTGFQWKLEKIDDGLAGKKPTITYTIADKAGAPLAATDFARIAATIAGPTTDYVGFTNGYVQEDIRANSKCSNGRCTYTFTNAIPADAKGTFAVGLEGRRLETVLKGTAQQRDIQYGRTNPVLYFAVDGSKIAPRRTPTNISNCNACHTRLALHGENRVNNVEYCVFCHNPVESDATRRPASAGAAQTIDMSFMVHRIHGGEELNQFYGTDYVVYGFGGTPTSFAEVRYPGGLNQCFLCHNNGSENVPSNSINYSKVKTPRYPINPMPAITTACYGCHDSTVMLAHAQTNTGGLGEACATCHSSSGDFAPTKVHASEVTVEKSQGSK
jgi:OmcA/MtrC family decaheme c-type cytochrome